MIVVAQGVMLQTTSAPKNVSIAVKGGVVRFTDDAYSDRIRCDHPPASVDGQRLGQALLDHAGHAGRGRVVSFVPSAVAEGMAEVGFSAEGLLPNFYEHAPCIVMAAYPDLDRGQLADPEAVGRVQALLGWPRDARRVTTPTIRARREDADDIADLLGETFAQYPTPSSDPEYIREAIDEGTPFRIVRENDSVIACASADLVPSALSAELTDCATRPECRGRGLMQAILSDLIKDLQRMEYRTAFTLARANVAGVNLAFERLSFTYSGLMTQSCRIGSGLEDMNIWTRNLTTN